MSWSRFGVISLSAWLCATALTPLAAQSPSDNAPIIRMGMVAGPKNINPIHVQVTYGAQIALFSFAQLVDLDPQSGPQPDLAESWTISEDGLTYRFRIREDARWSDGTPITAQTIAESFRHHRNLTEASYADDLNAMDIAVVEGEDGPELQLTLPEPDSTFLSDLASQRASPLPMHRADLLERHDDWLNLPMEELVFSGPYKITALSEEHLSLRPNDQHFNRDQLQNAGIDFTIYGEKDQQAVPDMRSGAIDLVIMRNSGQSEFLREALPDLLVSVDVPSLTYLSLNMEAPPLDDLRIRQALHLASLRLAESSFIGDNLLTPVHNLMPTLTQARFLREEDARPVPDGAAALEQARQIMTALGYSSAAPLELELAINQSDINQRLANLLRALWQPIFVDLTVVERPLREHYDQLGAQDFQVGRAAARASQNHPSSLLNVQHSTHSFNYGGFENAEYDRILTALSQQNDLSALRDLSADALAILREDLPVIPLYQVQDIILRQPDIRWGRTDFSGLMDLTTLTKQASDM